MDQVLEFFRKLFDSSDWPPRWHCGRWTEFHGWLYIISDLLIWSAYFTIPLVIIRYISRKQGLRFVRLYFLFAAFILACGATHFLDALAFWVPAYRLNALFRLLTAALSWATVFYLIKYLPIVFSLRSQKDLEKEIELRRTSEEKFRGLLEAAPDAMIIANENAEIVLVNQQTGKLLGYEKSELIGQPVPLLIPLAPGEGHGERPAGYFADLDLAIAKGQDLFAIKKDGAQFPVEISLSPLSDEKGTLISASVRDITDRKKAEAALGKLNDELEERVKVQAAEVYKSEKRFRAMIENDSDFINVSDASHKILYRSPSAYRITGWDNEEMTDSEAFLHIHPADREKAAQVLREATANPGKPVSATLRTLHKNGQYIWLEGMVTNLLHDDNVKGFISNYHDITEHVQAHERLLASEVRYRRLFEAAKDGILILNSDSAVIEDANPFLMSILGYSRAELLGKQLWEIGLFKDITENKTAFQNLKKQGYSRYDNLPLQTKAKNTIWVEFVSNVYDVNGTPVVQCNIRDMTERKMAEQQRMESFQEKQEMVERMSTILNTLPANIAMIDENGMIIELNESWKKFAHQSGLVGRSAGDDYINFVASAFGADVQDCKAAALGIRNVLQKKDSEFVYEYACNPKGIKRWFRMVVTPLQEKEYSGAVVMHIDISELRKLEQERLDSTMREQKKLAQAILKAQEKERVAIGAELHDNVNQVLAATNLFLSIAKKNPGKSLAHIESSMANIQYAIDQNRRIAHELVAPDFEEMKLTGLIYKLTEDMLKITGIDVRIEATDMDEGMLGEEQKLAIYRIAQEQCSNIIKYASADHVTISFSTAGGILKMIISDDGKGMDPAKKTSGIGLKNINGRLSIFGGDAQITTSPGKGFVLEMSFPI